jgi:alpha-L-fucosidase
MSANEGKTAVRKTHGLLMLCAAIAANHCGPVIAEGPEATLARPSAAQYEYHELERIMFIHFHPGTWHGVEYDNGKTDLREINPTKLDTDQWCEAAKSWGARQILYVAKHCGGFCWWQTDTTEYSIKNTPYKDGQGDVLKEITDSCRKYGLKFGVYVYPGDPAWGAGIGTGGITADPAKQEAYNKVLRQQLAETWTRYGPINEAWFDGSCKVPIADLVEKHLSDAVILQSPQANIRWVGNEAGLAPYPAWNSLSSTDLKTGLSTALHGNPDGDTWAPLECDVPLYNHAWLWSKEKEKLRRSLNDLLNIYYKSVGRGAVMLLNATPNTDGLIPEGDLKRYRELGEELDRRFANPLGQTAGQGALHTIQFDRPTKIDQFMIMEDYRQGERIREYVVEARTTAGQWATLNTGSSVGRKRIVMFEPVEATKVALRITQSAGEPLVRDFKVYFVPGDNEFLSEQPTLQDAISTGAKATASDEHSAAFSAERIGDGNPSTRWATGSKWGTLEAMKPPYAAWIELDLGEEKTADAMAVVEGWDRTRKFRAEYRSSKQDEWKTALSGTTLGAVYHNKFPKATGRYWRLNILESLDSPTIWEWQLFNTQETGKWQKCDTIAPGAFENGLAQIDVDLRPYITKPGQFLVRLDDLDESDIEIESIRLLYNGREALEGILSPIQQGELYTINRTAAVVQQSNITLKLNLRTEKSQEARMEISIKRVF